MIKQKYTLMCHLMRQIYKNDSICTSEEHVPIIEENVNNDAESLSAAYYLIIVIGFYSLSIVFLIIFNSKFKIVCKNRSCYCDDTYEEDDLYESQKKETKNTVKLIFNSDPKTTAQNYSSQLLLSTSILYNKKHSNDSAFQDDNTNNNDYDDDDDDDDNSNFDKNSFFIESSL
jgi:hypothetical protein